MREQLKHLYELQEVDTAIDRTRKTMEALDGGTAVAARVNKGTKEVAAAETEVRKARADLHDVEMALKSAEDKRSTYRLKLSSGRVTSARELEAMQKEIDMLTRNIGDLEEKALTLMDALDPMAGELEERRKALAELERQLAEVRAAQAKEQERLSATLRDLDAQRQGLTSRVPSDLLQRYDKLRPRFGTARVAVVEGGACGFCRMSISTFLLRELREDTAVLTCENCRRILYLPEGR
jgi:uncharacterized protein